MNNLALSFQWAEINYCRDDWEKIVKSTSKDLHEDNTRKIKSVIDRLKQALGEVNDVFENMMQGKAEMMGNAFQV